MRDICLGTGCEDGTLLYWQLLEQPVSGLPAAATDKLLRAVLLWRTTTAALCAAGTQLDDAQGLSAANAALLKRRGATRDPQQMPSTSDKS